eukprot:jgi/Chrzof1/11523/UNPLg00457.t1_GUN2B[v5.2]
MAAEKPQLLLEMRKATRRSHNVANVLILSKLAVVLTDKQLYGRALSCFYPVYSCLEHLVQKHSDTPELAPVVKVVSNIPRKAAMEEDLQFYLGPNWANHLAKSRAAEAYVQHLHLLSEQNPVLLLPYAYSFYIPIVLGFLGQRIHRALQLDSDEGLAFFSVPDKSMRLQELRDAVNAAGKMMSQQVRQQVVQEAVTHFKLNNSVVAEFSVGYQAMMDAVRRALLALPAWADAVLVGVGYASIFWLVSVLSP